MSVLLFTDELEKLILYNIICLSALFLSYN